MAQLPLVEIRAPDSSGWKEYLREGSPESEQFSADLFLELRKMGEREEPLRLSTFDPGF